VQNKGIEWNSIKIESMGLRINIPGRMSFAFQPEKNPIRGEEDIRDFISGTSSNDKAVYLLLMRMLCCHFLSLTIQYLCIGTQANETLPIDAEDRQLGHL
jgi:hypothetical protein